MMIYALGLLARGVTGVGVGGLEGCLEEQEEEEEEEVLPSTSRLELPDHFIKMFMVATLPKLGVCSCQALSNIAWGLATVVSHVSPSDRGLSSSEIAPPSFAAQWISAFSSASLSCMALFNDQELSITAWSLGRLGLHPGDAWMKELEVSLLIC